MDDHARQMMLEIVTPYFQFFEGHVRSINLHALDGPFHIMPGHQSVVIALTPGIAKIQLANKDRYASLTNGYAEVGPKMTLVVCNAAEWPDEIDVERALRAYRRATDRIKDESLPSRERVFARHSARRAKIRLQTAKRYGTPEQKKQLKNILID